MSALVQQPFRIDGPAIVSFSGGRSSGYMLSKMLDAWEGKLPADVIPVFANTGKEMPQTLDFVRDCQEQWGCPIVWLEWCDGDPGNRYVHVSHATASRDGKPFAALIQKKKYLPNPVTRFCTSDLKISVMRDFARNLGWQHWTNIIGLRADEHSRVSKARAKRDLWDNAMPLAAAGVTKELVSAFWATNSFDLMLPSVNGKTIAGNCDLCFLKGASTIAALIRDNPGLAQWWMEQEAALTSPTRPMGALFRKDRPSYSAISAYVANQTVLNFDIDADASLDDCGCTE